MSENIQVITSEFVKLNVSNSSNDVVSFEKKFDKKLTIGELKVRKKRSRMTHAQWDLLINHKY